MNQEEWSKMYLDKDKPYDFWDDPDKTNKNNDREDIEQEEDTSSEVKFGLSLKKDPAEQKEDSNSKEVYDEFLLEKELSDNKAYITNAPYNGGDYNPYSSGDAYSVATNASVNKTRLLDSNHLPIVTVMLIIANVIAGILCMQSDADHILSGGINYEYITKNFEFGRFISYMFLHSGIEHLAGNMVCLFLFGYAVEKKLGSLRTMIIYFASGIGAGIGSTFISHAINPDRVRFCVGASGAVFGVMCAYIFVDKMRNGKAKQSDMISSIALVVVYAVISMRGNVDIYGHIFGAIIGGICAFALNVKKWEDYHESKFMTVVGAIICLWFCLMGIGEANIGKDAKALPDERAEFIKEQPIFVGEYDVTFGKGLAFDCVDGKWIAFTSTDGEDIVEFNGTSYYKAGSHKITVQFILHDKGKDFSICYFAIDDVGQDGEAAKEYFTSVCNRYRSSYK